MNIYKKKCNVSCSAKSYRYKTYYEIKLKYYESAKNINYRNCFIYSLHSS